MHQSFFQKKKNNSFCLNIYKILKYLITIRPCIFTTSTTKILIQFFFIYFELNQFPSVGFRLVKMYE